MKFDILPDKQQAYVDWLTQGGTLKAQLSGLQFASSKLYPTGARLSQKAMTRLECRLYRLPGLEKWFVDILPLNYLTRI